MERSTLKADALLLLAAAIWGSGFVAQRLGMEHVGPYAFTGIRFAIGVIVLLPFVFIRSRKPRSETPVETRLAQRVMPAVRTAAALRWRTSQIAVTPA